MSNLRILIAGCGDVGTQLGTELNRMGHSITGLRRNIKPLPASIQGFSGDLSAPETLQALKDLPAFDIVVYCATANEYSEAGYKAAYVEGLNHLVAALPEAPKHLFFTSSTSVYHQNDGGWVDELSPTEPTSYSGQVMLQAEANVLAQPFAATVVRFSGIYGPGRFHLLKQIKAGKGAPETPTLFSNRIHRDDCAGALCHLITMVANEQPIAPLYVASDDTPSTMYEVSQWLAEASGVTLSDFSLSRRAGSKRCNNMRLKATGFQFKYPSYQAGYKALLSK